MEQSDPAKSLRHLTEAEAAKLRVSSNPTRPILPRVQTSQRGTRYRASEIEKLIQSKSVGR